MKLTKNNPDLPISLMSWILFLICSSGLLFMGYQCVEQYLAYPTAIDISNHPNQEFFHKLAFTFAARTYPSPYNLTNLEKCGLNYSDIKSGHFVGKGSPECEDPEKFWDLILPKPTEYGIKTISVNYFDGDKKQVTVQDLNWKIDLLSAIYTSVTISFPKTTKEIVMLKIDLDLNVDLVLIVHEKEMLNYITHFFL